MTDYLDPDTWLDSESTDMPLVYGLGIAHATNPASLADSAHAAMRIMALEANDVDDALELQKMENEI